MYYTRIFTNFKKSLIIGDSTIPEVIKNDIISGSTKRITEAARKAGKGSKRYDQLKSTVISFTPMGQFTGSKNKDLADLSGYVYIDVDNQELDTQHLKSIPCLYAFWRSLSGKGYGLLFKVDKSSYTAKDINKVIQAIASKYNIPADKNARSLNRAVCISYDPDTFINDDVQDYIYDSVNDVSDDKYNTFKPAFLKTNKTKKTESSATCVFDRVTEDIEHDETHIIFKDEQNAIKPKQLIEFYRARIPEGKRYTTLSVIANKAVAYFSESFSDDRIYEFFLTYRTLCENGVSLEEMHRIFSTAIKHRAQGTLKVFTKTRFGKVNPRMPDDVKKWAAQQIGAEAKKYNSKAAITKAIEDFKAEGIKYTQLMVKEASGKGLRTVQKYWGEVHELINNKPSKAPKIKVISTQTEEQMKEDKLLNLINEAFAEMREEESKQPEPNEHTEPAHGPGPVQEPTAKRVNLKIKNKDVVTFFRKGNDTFAEITLFGTETLDITDLDLSPEGMEGFTLQDFQRLHSESMGYKYYGEEQEVLAF